MAERLDPGQLDGSDLEGLTLPVLPLANGVVLPQMVVTLALETDEAKAAGEAAAETGQILLVPRFDNGRYGRVGTIANIENRGTLPGGAPALVVRATARAHVGAGVIGTTAALWVGVEPVAETPPTERARELARDVRAAVSALFDQLGGRRLTEVLRGRRGPRRARPTWPAGGPTSPSSARSSCSRRSTSRSGSPRCSSGSRRPWPSSRCPSASARK